MIETIKQTTTKQQTINKFVKLWLQTSNITKQMYCYSGYTTIFDDFATKEDFENLNVDNFYLSNKILQTFDIIDKLFDSFQDNLENDKDYLDLCFQNIHNTVYDFISESLTDCDVDLLNTLNVIDLIASYSEDYYNFTKEGLQK